MSKITDIDALVSAGRTAGLSRRKFLERAAQAGIIAGAARFGLPSVFAQSPSVPGKPNLIVGASTFIPASGFSLSGTIADGQTVTLTKSGGGFGTKPNGAKPLYWWPFESDANPSSLSRNTTNPSGTANGAISSSLVAPGSASAWRWDLALASSNVFLGVPFTSDSLYVWVKRYYDFDFSTLPTFNLKPFRMYDASENQDVLCGLQGAEGTNGNPRYIADPTESYAHWGGNAFTGHAWRMEEWIYQAGSLNVTDGRLDHVLNGRYAFTPGSGFLMRTTAWPNKYVTLYLDQHSDASSLANAPMYLDSYYVDDSWCRVLISDEPAWQVTTQPAGKACAREIQIPTAWSDTSISLVLRRGSHTSLVGKHLYVILGDGTPLAVGAFS
jgi:hypothetical protein